MFRIASLFAGASLLVLAPTTGFAQSGTDGGEAALSEIVVTAQRRTERLQDVPLTVSAKTGEDLARLGISNTRDLTLAVPGLSFTTQGALAEPAIRGVQTTSGQIGANSPIAIYVDGFYMPNQVGNLFDLPDVSQVEVLKGPQGTLFGRNATGGAISIHTREPVLGDATGVITVSDGVYLGDDVKTSNDFTLKGFVSVPLSDTLALSVTGLYNYVPGFLTNDRNGGRYGRIEGYLARVKLLYRPSDRMQFLLAGMYGKRKDNSSGTLFPLGGLTTGALYPGAIVPQKPWHTAGEMNGGGHVLQDYRGVNFTAEFDFENLGKLTSKTGYTRVFAPILTDVDSTYSPACLAVVACVNYDFQTGPNKTFQQEFSFTSESFGPLSFVLGALYYHDSQDGVQNVNPPQRADGTVQAGVSGGIFYNAYVAKTEAKSVFGEVYFEVTEQLRLIGGLRYSDEEKTGLNPLLTVPSGHWKAWTPRVSLLYKLSPSANLYATYSKGFKSGILNMDSGAPGADPENLTSYEVGAKISDANYRLNVSGFFYNYRNLQVQFFDGIFVKATNAASARIYGLDVDGAVQLGGGFELQAAAEWMPYAKFRSYPAALDFAPPLGPFGLSQVVVDAKGLRLLKAPKFSGSLTALHHRDIDWGRLEASATVFSSTSMKWDVIGRVKTKAYATLNARISLTPENSKMKYSLWGRNLTNEAYISGSILSATADTVIFSQPREIGVSVDYSF